MNDIFNELQEMRKNLAEDRPVKKIRLPVMHWLRKDPLGDIYNSADTLLNEGNVYYGVVVQANELLFKRFNIYDCPMNVIYSTSNFFNKHPDMLHTAAHYIYSFKNTDEAPPEIKKVVNSVTDEYERLIDSPVDMKDIPVLNFLPELNNTTAYFTTVMVFRKHIPKGYIKGWLVPIIAMDRKPHSVMVLPKKYWSKGFIENYWI